MKPQLIVTQQQGSFLTEIPDSVTTVTFFLLPLFLTFRQHAGVVEEGTGVTSVTYTSGSAF